MDAPLPIPATPVRFGRRVGNFAIDLRVARYYRRVESFSYLKWARSWIGAREVHFAWDDLRPWFGSIHSFFVKAGRGFYRQFPSTFPSPEDWRAGLWQGAAESADPETERQTEPDAVPVDTAA